MTFSIQGYEAEAQRLEGWLAQRVADRPARYAQAGTYALSSIELEVMKLLVARGSAVGRMCEPMAPLVNDALGKLAGQAATSTLSFSELGTLDIFGAMAASGVSFPDTTIAAARTVPQAIATARSDEYPYNHWRRGLAGLALDVPAVYRGIAGFELNEPIPFAPGQSFGPNVQGFLGHLAGAVENHAPIGQCLDAWADFAAHSAALRQAKMFQTDMFLWAAWILHHRIAGQPLATVADWMHESLYRLAGEAA